APAWNCSATWRRSRCCATCGRPGRRADRGTRAGAGAVGVPPRARTRCVTVGSSAPQMGPCGTDRCEGDMTCGDADPRPRCDGDLGYRAYLYRLMTLCHFPCVARALAPRSTPCAIRVEHSIFRWRQALAITVPTRPCLACT